MILAITLDGQSHSEDLPPDVASQEAREWRQLGAQVRLKPSLEERLAAIRARQRQRELIREHVWAVADGRA